MVQVRAVNYYGDPVLHHRQNLFDLCTRQRESSSKVDMYMSMNHEMSVHHVYAAPTYIPDHLRVSFSRFRLSAHRLRVETGRWMRIPRNERLCVCNIDIQNEAHVMFHCPITLPIRQTYHIDNIDDWKSLYQRPLIEICDIIHRIMLEFP